MDEFVNGSYIKYHVDKNNYVTSYTCVIKPAVEEFTKIISKNLYVDGTFCCGQFHLLCFCFLDANDHLQPIAGQYCLSEDHVNLELMFTEVWNAGLKDIKNLTIVSDEGTAITKFVEIIQEKYTSIKIDHVNCIVHLLRHVKDKMKKEGTDEYYNEVNHYFYKARRSPTEEIAKENLLCIKDYSEAAYDYITNNRMSSFIYTYETSHFLADTNNVSESVNAMFLSLEEEGNKVRKASSYGLLYRFILVALNQMKNRRVEAQSFAKNEMKLYKNYNYYSKYIMRYVVHLGYQYEMYSNHYTVLNPNSNIKQLFKVKDAIWGCTFEVDFNKRECSCLHFQQMKCPCIHAIAVLHTKNMHYDVLTYADDGYVNYNIMMNIFDIRDDYEEVLFHDINSKSTLSKEEERSIQNLFVIVPTKKKIEKRVLSIGEDITKRNGKKGKTKKQAKKKKKEKKETTRRKCMRNMDNTIIALKRQPPRQCKLKRTRQ